MEMKYDFSKIYSGNFILKKGAIFDDTENEMGSLHPRVKYLKTGIKVTSNIGYLLFFNDQPDQIQLINSQEQELGILHFKDDKLLLEVKGTYYHINYTTNSTEDVIDENGQSLLFIDEILATKLNNFVSSQQFILKNILSLELATLIVLYVVYSDKFTTRIYPSDYSFKCKITNFGTLTFFDTEGRLFAKTARSKFEYVSIIGIIILIYGIYLLLQGQFSGAYVIIIGFFTLVLLIALTSRKITIILQDSGERISTISANFLSTEVNFSIPSINWSGNIEFHNDNELPDAIIRASDGNYISYHLTTIEKSNGAKMMKIYHEVPGNHFTIKDYNDFKYYKSLVLSVILINKIHSKEEY